MDSKEENQYVIIPVETAQILVNIIEFASKNSVFDINEYHIVYGTYQTLKNAIENGKITLKDENSSNEENA